VMERWFLLSYIIDFK